MQLNAAGNTLIPGILLIRELGYSLTIDKKKSLCIAEKDGNSFIANDPVTVLGLIKLFEVRGENWRASDDEIDQGLKDFI